MKWIIGLLLLASPARAQKAVMEGVASSRYAIKVDTVNGRVDVATTSYTGAVPNTGLHVASNVVVDSPTQKDSCVIYATGSLACLGELRFSSGTFTGVGSATFSITSSSGIHLISGIIQMADGSVFFSTSQFGSGGGGSASTMTVSFGEDNFLQIVNGVTKSFTLSQTPQSSSAVWVVLDGLLQSGTSDYSVSGPVITMTTAPASNSSGFFIRYAVNTSTLPGVMVLNSTQSATAINTFTAGITIPQCAFTIVASTIIIGACPAMTGGSQVLASSYNVVASTGVYFSLAFSTQPVYRIRIREIPSTSHDLKIVFNFDQGARYHWQGRGAVLNTTLVEGSESGTAGYCNAQTGSDTNNTGDFYTCTVEFSLQTNNTNNVATRTDQVGYNASRAFEEDFTNKFTYFGQFPVTSVGVVPSAGNFRGDVVFERVNQ